MGDAVYFLCPWMSCGGNVREMLQRDCFAFVTPLLCQKKEPVPKGEALITKTETESVPSEERKLFLEDLVKAENEEAISEEEETQAETDEEEMDITETIGEEAKQEEIRAESDEDLRQTAFEPREKVREIKAEELNEYETLVKQFYTIDPTTMVGSDQLNVTKLLSYDMSIDRETDGPQILIYHTHSQEGYLDSIPDDPDTHIVGVGEELARILREDYGYDVLHHTGEYDKPSRNEAYSRALPNVERILEEYPSIQVVIDLHRDEMPEKTRLVTEIDGEKMAKFMFFNGLSRTKRTGNLDYLYNVYQEENLAFSFQMEKAAQEYYPGLTRKIYLKGYRYNMHLKARTLLIELGAQNNTLEEAMNACGPLAHVLDLVLAP